jgi:hypothetical protein
VEIWLFDRRLSLVKIFEEGFSRGVVFSLVIARCRGGDFYLFVVVF